MWIVSVEPFNRQSSDSECEDRTQTARAAVFGRAIKFPVDALNQCARNIHGGTASEVVKHPLDSGRGDLEQGAVIPYASTRRTVEIPVAPLNQRRTRTTAVCDSDETTRKRIEHHLGADRCDLEYGALTARPVTRCAIEIPVAALN